MEEENEELTEQIQDEDEPTAKKKKQKKVVHRRKSKKEKEKPLSSAIRLTVEGGKVEFGARKGLTAGPAAANLKHRKKTARLFGQLRILAKNLLIGR